MFRNSHLSPPPRLIVTSRHTLSHLAPWVGIGVTLAFAASVIVGVR